MAVLHIAVVLSPFLAIPLVSWAGRKRIVRSVLPALIPGLLAVYFTLISIVVSSSGPFSISAEWAPALNLSLSFRFDGLSTLFATLITVVGTLIVVYAAKYFEHHPHVGRFNASLFAFMGSMLGLVLSDNVIALFVFWELTTIPVDSRFAINDGGDERCSSFSVETVVVRRTGAAFPCSFRPRRMSSSSVSCWQS